MCLVFCGDYIIPYIGSVLLFYFEFSIKKFGFLGVRSLSFNFVQDSKQSEEFPIVAFEFPLFIFI